MAEGDWGDRWYLEYLQEVFVLKQRRTNERFQSGSQQLK